MRKFLLHVFNFLIVFNSIFIYAGHKKRVGGANRHKFGADHCPSPVGAVPPAALPAVAAAIVSVASQQDKQITFGDDVDTLARLEEPKKSSPVLKAKSQPLLSREEASVDDLVKQKVLILMGEALPAEIFFQKLDEILFSFKEHPLYGLLYEFILVESSKVRLFVMSPKLFLQIKRFIILWLDWGHNYKQHTLVAPVSLNKLFCDLSSFYRCTEKIIRLGDVLQQFSPEIDQEWDVELVGLNHIGEKQVVLAGEPLVLFNCEQLKASIHDGEKLVPISQKNIFALLVWLKILRQKIAALKKSYPIAFVQDVALGLASNHEFIFSALQHFKERLFPSAVIEISDSGSECSGCVVVEGMQEYDDDGIYTIVDPVAEGQDEVVYSEVSFDSGLPEPCMPEKQVSSWEPNLLDQTSFPHYALRWTPRETGVIKVFEGCYYFSGDIALRLKQEIENFCLMSKVDGLT